MHQMTKNEIDRATTRLAARQYGVISRAQASALGAGRSAIAVRLDRGRWTAVYPGVYRVGGAPASWRQTLMAATLASGGAASHAAAAALWSLPSYPERPVEVIVARGGRRSSLFVVHRAGNLIAGDQVRIGPIPVTTAVRTLIDLCATTAEHRLAAALDDAIRRGLLTTQRLLKRIEMLGRGHAGLRVLRDLAADRAGMDAVPQSVLESAMLALLRAAGLPDPHLQYPIGRAIVDFAYPDARLVIEVDGYRWHGADPDRWQRDLSRQNDLIAAGWRVIRFTWDDVSTRADRVAWSVAGMLQEVLVRPIGGARDRGFSRDDV